MGHSFSANGLLLGKQDAVESALWAAIVALEERAEMSRRVLSRLERTGSETQLNRYREDLEQCAARVSVIKSLIHELVQEGTIGDPGSDGDAGAGGGPPGTSAGHRRPTR